MVDSSPSNRNVETATSAKTRSANGSINAPQRDVTRARRAMNPSRKSVAAATATSVRRASVPWTSTNATARTTRENEMAFGSARRAETISNPNGAPRTLASAHGRALASAFPGDTMAEVAELLKKVAIFKDLDDEELAQVAEVCKEEKFVSGEFIFREGEHGNRLYLIVEGDVRISRDVPGSGEEA